MARLGRKAAPSKERRDLTITKLERDKKGLWSCNVTVAGQTFPVHCKYGSWCYGEHGDPDFKHIDPEIAAAIQEKVYPIQRRERRERDEAKKAAAEKVKK